MRLLFPGSFDPPHHGHRDVLQRAANLVASVDGEVLLGIAEHPEKTGFLSLAERLTLLDALCAEIPRTRVLVYRGATVHAARDHGITALVRGLRHAQDLEGEKAMAEVNRRHGFDTIYFVTDARWSFLSSGFIRGVLAAGLPLDDLVPAPVAAALASRGQNPRP